MGFSGGYWRRGGHGGDDGFRGFEGAIEGWFMGKRETERRIRVTEVWTESRVDEN